jgi:NTE family protein
MSRIFRALVFQGVGALDAFQAGAFRALYEKLRSDDEKDNNANEPLFDIIAGTSIGAINAAILVSYVLENKTWKGSAKRLDFWRYISTPTSELSEALKQWRAEKEKGNASVASEAQSELWVQMDGRNCLFIYVHSSHFDSIF